ncbi:MAG: VWA domain-containing protein [Planctomycetota bacterium]
MTPSTQQLLASASVIVDPIDRLGAPAWLHALWLVPASVLCFWAASASRRRALRRFAEADLLPILVTSASPARRVLKATMIVTAVLLVAIALAQPRFNPTTREAERLGRDVVFIVDVSRSMLATDLAPSRLERSKIWIKDLITELDGDRVGLVAFAGAASVKSPLTLDRSFFRLSLDQLSPQSAPRGGTNIGDAIRKTVDTVFNLRAQPGDDAAPDTENAPRFRDIVLITDGEDQESFPVEAAAAAGALGVRTIAIGIGDSGEGASIPDPDDPDGRAITFQGAAVRSKLDAEMLTQMAEASPGNVFLNVGTGTIDLARVYRDLIATAEQRVVGSASVVEYDEFFWACLALAGLLLAVEPVIAQTKTLKQTPGGTAA